MDKYIGFDVDSKKTVACVIQKGERDRYVWLRKSWLPCGDALRRFRLTNQLAL